MFLTNVNGALFFRASNGTLGTELWKGPTVTFVLQATSNAQAQALITAVNNLPAQAVPITVELRLGAGVYTGIVARPPAGVTLIIRGAAAARRRSSAVHPH